MPRPVRITAKPGFVISVHEADLNRAINKIIPLYVASGSGKYKQKVKVKLGPLKVKFKLVSVHYSWHTKLESAAIDFQGGPNNTVIMRVKMSGGGKLGKVPLHITGSIKLGIGFSYDKKSNTIVASVKRVHGVNIHHVNNKIDKQIKDSANRAFANMQFPVLVPPINQTIPRTNRKIGIRVQKIKVTSDSLQIGISLFLSR